MCGSAAEVLQSVPGKHTHSGQPCRSKVEKLKNQISRMAGVGSITEPWALCDLGFRVVGLGL